MINPAGGHIVKILQDRTHKATAPEPPDPAKHGVMTPEESLKLFLESRTHTIAYVKTTQEDLRDHLFDHPVPAIGTLDAYSVDPADSRPFATAYGTNSGSKGRLEFPKAVEHHGRRSSCHPAF